MIACLAGLAWADPGDLLDRYTVRRAPPPEAAEPADVDPFAWDVEPATATIGQGGAITLDLHVPAGMHVYRDSVTVDVIDAGGLVLGTAERPPGLVRDDPALGDADRELYDLDVAIQLPVRAPTGPDHLAEVALDVHHQGCRAGLCYPPVTTRLIAWVHVEDAK
jgi:thiol:disulfide interchange protein